MEREGPPVGGECSRAYSREPDGQNVPLTSGRASGRHAFVILICLECGRAPRVENKKNFKQIFKRTNPSPKVEAYSERRINVKFIAHEDEEQTGISEKCTGMLGCCRIKGKIGGVEAVGRMPASEGRGSSIYFKEREQPLARSHKRTAKLFPK